MFSSSSISSTDIIRGHLVCRYTRNLLFIFSVCYKINIFRQPMDHKRTSLVEIRSILTDFYHKGFHQSVWVDSRGQWLKLLGCVWEVIKVTISRIEEKIGKNLRNSSSFLQFWFPFLDRYSNLWWFAIVSNFSDFPKIATHMLLVLLMTTDGQEPSIEAWFVKWFE